MIALVGDVRSEARAAAVEVLRWLVGPMPRSPVEPSPVVGAMERACVLVAMAQDERDARVRRAIVSAFLDLRHDVGVSLTRDFVLRFVRDADPGVRLAATAVLAGDASAEAIEALVQASRDADADVRDWACFGLGHMLGDPSLPEGIVDTAVIREALAARTSDPSVDVREEAITGLARRGDERGVAGVLALLERFDADGVSERVLDVAHDSPSPRYVAALEHIVFRSPTRPDALEALTACRGRRRMP